MASEELRVRVKGKVQFAFFRDMTLFYECDDGYVFGVPVDETIASDGNSPTFLAEDKGIYFMRWIRKSMQNEEGQ